MSRGGCQGRERTGSESCYIPPAPVAEFISACPPMLSAADQVSAEEEQATAAFHVMTGASESLARPVVNRIGIADVFDALKRGYDHSWRNRPLCFPVPDVPIAGVFLTLWTSGANLSPMGFPADGGFRVDGPIAAIGLYEISRRREAGLDASWRHALDVRDSPALPSIVAVGLMLAASSSSGR